MSLLAVRAQPAPPTHAELVELAVTRFMSASGLPEHVVRDMIAMEAAREPRSLAILAGRS